MFISCSISSFKDLPTSSLSWSTACWACSNCLTCLPICLIASRLLVLPYRHFTRQWANLPYVLMLVHCSDNLSEMLWVSYQLSREAISASEHPYGTYVVPKKVKFWGLQVLSWTESVTSSFQSSKLKVPQVNPVIRPTRDPEKQGTCDKLSGDLIPRDQNRSKSPDISRALTRYKS
jgi:hypothetical protein